MRMLLRVRMPTEPANRAMREGRYERVMEQMMTRLTPEASYFFAQGGHRGGFIIFDLADPSQIPAIAEPLFHELGAEVEFFPVMNQDDLMKGLTAAAQAAQ